MPCVLKFSSDQEIILHLLLSSLLFVGLFDGGKELSVRTCFSLKPFNVQIEYTRRLKIIKHTGARSENETEQITRSPVYGCVSCRIFPTLSSFYIRNVYMFTKSVKESFGVT